MSSGEVRRVSRQDIQLVQNLIERCLQLYMNQKEVVDTLLDQAKIEPSFTELVWQKLEEENREFFKAYHVKLMVKNQIVLFNKLLQKQAELMHEISPAGVSSVSLSNGSNTSLHQNASCYDSSPSVNNVQCPLVPSNAFINGGLPVHQSMQITDDATIHTGRMDNSTSLFANQNSHMDMLHGMNGITIKSEPSYSSNSQYTFSASSFFEPRPTSGDVHAPTFSSSDLNAQPLSDPILDIGASSFGILGQIPRNFSFSDLTDDFSQSADILESYGRSPFLGPESTNFSGSSGRECEGENRRLDTISEAAGYDELGSD